MTLSLFLIGIYTEKGRPENQINATPEELQRVEQRLQEQETKRQTPAPAPKPREPILKFTILQQLESRVDILVDANPPTESLKTFIKRLSETQCANKQICVLNFYDSKKAYDQLTDFSSTIYDDSYPESEFKKVENHFVGQFSRWPDQTVMRYKKNGRWVNF